MQSVRFSIAVAKVDGQIYIFAGSERKELCKLAHQKGSQVSFVDSSDVFYDTTVGFYIPEKGQRTTPSGRLAWTDFLLAIAASVFVAAVLDAATVTLRSGEIAILSVLTGLTCLITAMLWRAR